MQVVLCCYYSTRLTCINSGCFGVVCIKEKNNKALYNDLISRDAQDLVKPNQEVNKTRDRFLALVV